MPIANPPVTVATPRLDQALKDLNNPAETAAYLGLSISTLARWRAEKNVGPRWRKFGSAVRYSRADIEAYVEASLAEGVVMAKDPTARTAEKAVAASGMTDTITLNEAEPVRVSAATLRHIAGLLDFQYSPSTGEFFATLKDEAAGTAMPTAS